MAKKIHLLKFRQATNQRAHFAIYIHEGEFPGTGILVHVVGAPMAGFQLEIKLNYNLDNTQQRYTHHLLGQVSASTAATIKQLASNVRPPGISQNFMAPVDGVNNKRCQEWTKEYVQLLVQRHLLDQTALEIIQSQRDPPGFGIGLAPAGRGRGRG
ncbi:hypothetical protein RBB50_005227 [Rhinocladiella similis]